MPIQLSSKHNQTPPPLWVGDLSGAIQRDEMFMVFQPKFCKNEIVGYEALCRWQHPAFGFISPINFIDVAEKTGFILEIGKLAIDRSLMLVKSCANKGQLVSIAVNVSAIQLRKDNFAEFVNYIESKVVEYSTTNDSLIIEVTESQQIDRPDIIDALNELRLRGFKISLDDFGTGYSAFSIFNQINLSQLKIDKSFVQSIGTKKGNIIIESIVKLGYRLGMDVVCEGVETKEQYDFLTAMFPMIVIQGYYLSKPISVADIMKNLGEPH